MVDSVATQTITGFWVKVKDDEVLEVWDVEPDQDEKDTGLWTAAVEVFPEYVPGRQEVIGHTIDITQNPIQITYGKMDINVDSRIDNAKAQAQIYYRDVVIQEGNRALDEVDGTTDLDRIAAAKTRLDAITADLDAATTHDEFEAVDLDFTV